MSFTKLAPGVYVDDGDKSLHLDLIELCEAAGCDPTPQNQAVVAQAAMDMLEGRIPVEVELHQEADRPWQI